MVGIYFSGTGNTEHIVKRLVLRLDPLGECFALETPNAVKSIISTDKLILGYPTQYSNAPLIVRDYIKDHESIWNGKKVLIIATKGAFCGDVTGCSARLLKKFGAELEG